MNSLSIPHCFLSYIVYIVHVTGFAAITLPREMFGKTITVPADKEAVS